MIFCCLPIIIQDSAGGEDGELCTLATAFDKLTFWGVSFSFSVSQFLVKIYGMEIHLNAITETILTNSRHILCGDEVSV